MDNETTIIKIYHLIISLCAVIIIPAHTFPRVCIIHFLSGKPARSSLELSLSVKMAFDTCCSVCFRSFGISKDGLINTHGPKMSKCEGSRCPPVHSSSLCCPVCYRSVKISRSGYTRVHVSQRGKCIGSNSRPIVSSLLTNGGTKAVPPARPTARRGKRRAPSRTVFPFSLDTFSDPQATLQQVNNIDVRFFSYCFKCRQTLPPCQYTWLSFFACFI
jgi:hypothetical protein